MVVFGVVGQGHDGGGGDGGWWLLMEVLAVMVEMVAKGSDHGSK